MYLWLVTTFYTYPEQTPLQLTTLSGRTSDVSEEPQGLSHLWDFSRIPANSGAFAGHFASLSHPVIAALCFSADSGCAFPLVTAVFALFPGLCGGC